MLQVDLRAPESLLPEELKAWRAFQAGHAAFSSPLLSPTFARLVAQVRDDVRVAVFRQNGAVVGILAHHRRPGGLAGPLARGLGGPWSDEQALLTGADGLDGLTALAAAGLRACRFTGLIDPYGAFAGRVADGEASFAIALEGTAEAYMEELRAASPKRFKNLRRLDSKLGREHGDVELVAGDADTDSLSAVLAWKRDQFRRTGVHDVLGPDWSRAFIDAAFRSDAEEASGLLVTLKVGGKVVAGHFGLRSQHTYHPQIAAFDPAFSAYSPGMLLIARAIRAMPQLRLQRYELSGGCGHYKAAFASESTPLQEGLVTAGGRRRPFPAQPTLLVRVGRRFDRIVETELTLAGRIAGVAGALHGIPRRFSPQRTPHTEEA